jgi:alkylhydroperoxidase family enzyme
MPDPRVAFTLDTPPWTPWHGIGAEVEALLATVPDTSLIAPGQKPSGLPLGERALAAAAVARSLGCRAQASTEARNAATALKRDREVRVLLEEGVPCPLTGRLGAVISAAGALARSPAILSSPDLQRLKDEKLDDQDITDLILTAAIASWSARITLGLGQPATD